MKKSVNQHQNDLHDEEIDLRELFTFLWSKRLWIIGVSSVFAIVSSIWVLQIPNEYRASTTLAPTVSDSKSIAGLMPSQLGGLASLAGINLGDRNADDTTIAIEIMQSWGFIESFIEQNGLDVNLMAVVGWDSNKNQLIVNEELYDVKNEKWKLSDGKTTEPTSWQMFTSFSERFTILRNLDTGLIHLSIDYYSPIVAKEWLELLVTSINQHMRLRKLQQANNNIEYLQTQINKTSITEMQEIFYKIIQEETKNKMLAEASPQYAFSTVGQAMLPEQKYKPKRSKVVILSTLVGGILVVLFMIFLYIMNLGRFKSSHQGQLD